MDRVVFNCNIFAQALLSPTGPASRCLQLVRDGQIELCTSEYVLDEIRELYLKLPPRAAVTQDDTEDLALQVRSISRVVRTVPPVFTHPIDRDDSEYVNLAIATESAVVISRDRHLLRLSDPAIDWSKDFRSRYPTIRFLTPEQFLADRSKS